MSGYPPSYFEGWDDLDGDMSLGAFDWLSLLINMIHTCHFKTSLCNMGFFINLGINKELRLNWGWVIQEQTINCLYGIHSCLYPINSLHVGLAFIKLSFTFRFYTVGINLSLTVMWRNNFSQRFDLGLPFFSFFAMSSHFCIFFNQEMKIAIVTKPKIPFFKNS